MKICSEELRDAVRLLLEIAVCIDCVNPEYLVDELHEQIDIVTELIA